VGQQVGQQVGDPGRWVGQQVGQQVGEQGRRSRRCFWPRPLECARVGCCAKEERAG
jgi:hypothetical protein